MRARNLKPGFFKNPDLCSLPIQHRLLFQGLWCLADAHGRLKDDWRLIKVEIFPWDELPIDQMLDELANSDGSFIERYEVGGVRVIQITNFSKHQKPHTKELEKESIFPNKPEKNQASRKKSQPVRLNDEVLNVESPLLESRIPESEKIPTPSPKVRTLVRDDWRPDEKIHVWIQKKYPFLVGHKFEDALEDYKTKCKKNGYKYLEHYSAFQDFCNSPFREWNKAREPSKPSAIMKPGVHTQTGQLEI